MELRFRNIVRDQHGASAVEFAICGAILIFLSLGVIEFGRALLVRNELSYAADRATRVVLMDPGASDSTVAAAARTAFEEHADLLAVTVDEETVDGLPSRVITLTYPIDLLVPIPSGGSFNVSISRRISRG
jgi:Flp pilus assembly protein TadG